MIEEGDEEIRQVLVTLIEESRTRVLGAGRRREPFVVWFFTPEPTSRRTSQKNKKYSTLNRILADQAVAFRLCDVFCHRGASLGEQFANPEGVAD